mgnify:CR=1 FL=1
MVAHMRADMVVSTMMTIAQKIDGMDKRLTEGQARLIEEQVRLTEGQARLEKRLDDVVEEQGRLRADLAEVRSELKADIAVVAENTHSLNRKLNILLDRFGIAE